MRRLTFIIEAGEHTCRDGADGPWCPHVYRTGIADRPALTDMCGLFGKVLPIVTKAGKLTRGKGWLGRLPECKAAEDVGAHSSKDAAEALKAGIVAALRSNGVRARTTKSGVRVTAKGPAKCNGEPR